MKTTRRELIAWSAAAAALGLAGCSTDSGGDAGSVAPSDSSSPTPIENLRVWVPTTLAFMAPMAAFGDRLTSEGTVREVTVDNWATVDVLTSLLLNGEADVAATPSYVSANLYNKGAGIKLAAITVWGMLYVIGPKQDEGSNDLALLTGQRVGVPLPGNMPDLIFRYLVAQKGIDIEDIDVVSYNDSQELMNAFVSGQLDWAVLPEHPATVAIAQSTQQGREVGRVVDMQQVWAEVTGSDARFPMAGIAVPDAVAADTALLGAILDDMEQAVETVNAADDDICARINEFTQVDAAIVKQVIPRLQLQMMPAAQCKDELTDFYERLATVNPEIIGGQVPDDAFFLTDPRE
ncbi:MAG: ABC transporter substrate-binding protein [Propionibacteriaceae bacterium]|nr:ABC transporter substrate-binding protein [Propionibacteriaceae bacterium]